jgi:hypothetical protein
MKKLLLLVIPVLAITGIVNAQEEGYSWYFDTAPFNSTPAITGASGSYTLAEVGTGSITPGISDNVGTGPSCSGPINVGQFTKPYGLQFSNSPQIISGTYTIEMVVQFADVSNWVRLAGFSAGGEGLYIAPGGADMGFYDGTTVTYLTVTINTSTWYHIMFKRNAATKEISLYVDNILVGKYSDTADVFVPQTGNSNVITFFKDDNGEESDGAVAKLSVFNKELTPIQVGESYSNVCTPAFALAASNFSEQGYQWTFGTAPFNSSPADAASTGNYPLSAIGSGSFSTLNTAVGLGASCLGNIDVGQYTAPFGFEMNNNPQFVANTYSIEMVVKFTAGGPIIRLVGFNDLFGPNGDNGVYLNSSSDVEFYSATNGPSIITGGPVSNNTWYHLVFVRNGATKEISYYQNGVLIGSITDTNDEFVPQNEASYNITLLKDEADFTEEADGQIAKAAVFNKALTPTQVLERFNNICNTNLIILPVSLKNFIAKKEGSKVDLTWTTSSETNNLGFEVQRSNNGSAYTKIGFVSSVGNTTAEVKYQFTDPAPLPGKNYYRLKQIGLDNRTTLSAIRILDISKELQDLQVYPNPSHNILTILNIKSGNLLNVFDSQGRAVLSKRANNGQETIATEKLSSGVYILQVTDDTGNRRSIRFTKF